MKVLKNCRYVATFDDEGRELENVDILIKENKISKIGENIQADAEEFDCSRFIVIPGLVNTHHHFFQILTRNLKDAQNSKLFDWLVYHYPIWKHIDEEAVYYATKLAIVELLKTGVTTTSDHHYLHPKGVTGDIMEIQVEVASELGVRFAPTRGSMTMGEKDGGLPPEDLVEPDDVVIKDMQRVVEKFHDPSDFSMTRVILAPCSPFNVTLDLMMETEKLARSYGVFMHTHLAETKDEEHYCLEKYGKRPLALMEELNWLGPDVYFAHGIWFNDDELRLLKETGTGVSHCPSSNMRLGSGIARIREMMDMGIRIGLGVDGSASNDTSDMLGEVRNALLLQRVKYGSAGLTAREALHLATRGGASILGFSKIGQIKEGHAADLVLVDLYKMQRAGSLEDPVASLVFTGYNHEVDYSFINGEMVVNNGRVKKVDEEELAQKVNVIARNLIEKNH